MLLRLTHPPLLTTLAPAPDLMTLDPPPAPDPCPQLGPYLPLHLSRGLRRSSCTWPVTPTLHTPHPTPHTRLPTPHSPLPTPHTTLPTPHPRYEPENAKLHFRRGKALSLKGDYEEAEDALKMWVGR